MFEYLITTSVSIVIYRGKKARENIKKITREDTIIECKKSK